VQHRAFRRRPARATAFVLVSGGTAAGWLGSRLFFLRRGGALGRLDLGAFARGLLGGKALLFLALAALGFGALLGAALIFLGAALGFLGGALAVLDLAHFGFLEGALARLDLVFGQLVENNAAALISTAAGAGAGAAGFGSTAAGAAARGFRPALQAEPAAGFSSGRVNLRLRVSTTTDLDRPWLKFCRTVPLSPPERFSVSVRLPSAPVFLSSEVVSLIP
jgi:hypothetical protein